jgi:hypothetical protein
MLGPALFSEFARPELEAMCRRLQNNLYHMDGVGQLAFFDQLLDMPELDGIQWVPGAGRPRQIEWPEVMQGVYRAGKLNDVNHWRMEYFDAFARRLGIRKHCRFATVRLPLTREDEVRRWLDKWGAA